MRKEKVKSGGGVFQTQEPILKVHKQNFCKMLLDSLTVSNTEEKEERFLLKAIANFLQSTVES